MAHFAEIGLDNIVLKVIVVNDKDTADENGVERESIGQNFLRNLYGGTWLQTSYNKRIRKNFAMVGGFYDSSKDAFIPPKPWPSWRLDEVTCTWLPPIGKECPSTNGGLNTYEWREENQCWEQTN